ncbi:hypothetical protein KIMH_03240 [Bombiscardovia apis]|uniref:Uncharacterized protein n=1 Tax=Bombiscardovia apis TaxID=2932182 RepID=A0ABM8BBA7_9BIFI|nr:hypothetical protein KIMH_03240 [Bombiscardovia apis]
MALVLTGHQNAGQFSYIGDGDSLTSLGECPLGQESNQLAGGQVFVDKMTGERPPLVVKSEIYSARSELGVKLFVGALADAQVNLWEALGEGSNRL